MPSDLSIVASEKGRRIMKKAFLLITAALLMALILAGCWRTDGNIGNEGADKSSLIIKNETSQDLLMIRADTDALLKNGEDAAGYSDTPAFLLESGKSYILTADGDVIPQSDITPSDE
jgi:hypothetical protein